MLEEISTVILFLPLLRFIAVIGILFAVARVLESVANYINAQANKVRHERQ